MNTIDILEKTKKLVSASRHDKHGDKVINHENIARLWTGYLVNNFNITDSRTAFSFSENIKSNNKLLYTSHAKWLKWIKQEFTKATSR